MHRSIVRFAEHHHGLVTRDWLLGAGATRSQIAHWLSVGRLVKVRPSVYRLPGSPMTWAQGLHAVLQVTDGMADADFVDVIRSALDMPLGRSDAS